MLGKLTLILSLLPGGYGQIKATCQSDVLIDDFSKDSMALDPTLLTYTNLMGGNYGQMAVNMKVNTASKSMLIRPLPAVGDPKNMTNGWFVKLGQGACHDLTGYTGIQFDVIAPTKTGMNITLAQSDSTCTNQTADAAYIPIAKYLQPTGLKQTVFIPFYEFRKDADGGVFKFQKFRALVFTNIDGVFEVSNLVLRGCSRMTNFAGVFDGSSGNMKNWYFHPSLLLLAVFILF